LFASGAIIYAYVRGNPVNLIDTFGLNAGYHGDDGICGFWCWFNGIYNPPYKSEPILPPYPPGGAEDADETITDHEIDGWIYEPEDDPQIKADGSTKPRTWVTPDDYSSQEDAQDKLNPRKPCIGRRPVKIPAKTKIKIGRTPRGKGPYPGGGGANEILIPDGLPPGSAGQWQPLDPNCCN
jgi:hypothetical protein